jgi:hypothetical protein
MHQLDIKLNSLYKISFLFFYIIPVITIMIKLIYGFYVDSLMEIWFLGILFIDTFVFLSLTKIPKEARIKIIYVSISIIIFFFGLGAVGFESGLLGIDFSDTMMSYKLPYIIMLIIVSIQLIALIINGYAQGKTKHVKQITLNPRMNSMILRTMGVIVVSSYGISILLKGLIGVNPSYIMFELSVLSGYIILYLGLVFIARFEFKLSLKDSLTQALFFIPIMSIGLAIGILFFNESFVLFKLTTVITGVMNLILYLTISTLKKIKDKKNY